MRVVRISKPPIRVTKGLDLGSSNSRKSIYPHVYRKHRPNENPGL
jgi:hypothetical protein